LKEPRARLAKISEKGESRSPVVVLINVHAGFEAKAKNAIVKMDAQSQEDCSQW
jgi:hypothetical protein